MGLKSWQYIWDIDIQYWKSRATLIAKYNLSNHQLNLIGQRIDQWGRGDMWLMTITQKPLIDAFVCKDSNSIWPIPKSMNTIAIHGVLNHRWKILKERYQWTSMLQRM